MRKGIFTTTLFFFVHLVNAQLTASVVAQSGGHDFPLIAAGKAAVLVMDTHEAAPVQTAARLLQQDLEKISGNNTTLQSSVAGNIPHIIVGTLSKSTLLKKLVKEKKLDTLGWSKRWEAYRIVVIKNPFAGIEKVLVIAGSDNRGAAYGMMELSKQMGVSPWYWWADVPLKKQSELYWKESSRITDAPQVKYRGIFINDEAPALSGWAYERFGGFNHRLYEKVFELMLRVKANYIWPAMWGNAFYDDDPLNKKTAEDYGIIIGTSHHEPLMRAHDEWRRYGNGAWNYDSNALALQQFWREGMQRATNEMIVTVGMRGDGDEPMTEGTAIELLERIVAAQRNIIEEVSGKPAEQTPQLWALYKEVQDYYDKGMQVPDDVTLLLSDDNWGNIRRLPPPGAPERKGGYGVYYHFDYVGGPRNYKWINTNNLARVWEQMHRAWEYKAERIWIVNVGDIKPMELPISFFLDHAWNPDQWNEDNIQTYYNAWAAEQFGKANAEAIGSILRRYAQYASRRKPELLDASTYTVSLFADSEWDRISAQWRQLKTEAESIERKLPKEFLNAFFQLVLHPVQAFANVHFMYAAVAKNHFFAGRKDPVANSFADQAKDYYLQDSLLTIRYHTIANGKWNHMMDQTHIGYTYWQQPEKNTMPELQYVSSDEAGIPQNDIRTVSARDKIPAGLPTLVFYEEDGVVSMQAAHWSRVANTDSVWFKIIPGIGRDGDGITTFPLHAAIPNPAPEVQYEFYSYDSGAVTVNAWFSPTLNYHNEPEGLQYEIAIDEEAPQKISLNKEDQTEAVWEQWVANNATVKTSEHRILTPGKHSLKFRALSPGIILQKLVVNFGEMKKSYLGPAETLKLP